MKGSGERTPAGRVQNGRSKVTGDAGLKGKRVELEAEEDEAAVTMTTQG